MKKLLTALLVCTICTPVSAASIKGYSELLDNVVQCYNGVISRGTIGEMFHERKAKTPEEMPFVKPFEVQGETQIFVSVDGNDLDGDGSIEKPYKTFNKAVNVLRSMEYEKRKNGVTIYLREGEYAFSKEFNLDGKASGLDDAPVFISSYNDENVVFTNSMVMSLNDFTPVTDSKMLNRLYPEVRDKVLVYDMKAAGITDYGEIQYDDEKSGNSKVTEPAVYFGDDLAVLARYPNNNMLRIGEPIDVGAYVKTGKDDGNGFEWTMADDRAFNWVNTGEIAVYAYFSYNYWPEQQRCLSFNKEKNSVKNSGYPSHDGIKNGTQSTYYFKNVFEELDVEGEYFIDRTEGKIYVYPYSDNTEAPIYLSLANYNILNGNDAENIVFNGIKFKNSSGRGLYFTNCKNIVVQNCDFTNLYLGVTFNMCENSGVTTCYFYRNTGAVSTIQQYNYDKRKHMEINNSDEINNIFCQNCFIDGNDGVAERRNKVTLFMSGSVTSHNLSVDASNGGYGLGQSQWSVFEYNEAVGGNKEQNDGGELYTGGVYGARQLVRYNYFHKPSNNYNGRTGRGLYFDEGGGGFEVYSNIMEGHDMGSFSHGGKMGTYYNNIFYNNKQGISIGEHRHNSYLAERATAFNTSNGWWAGYNSNWFDFHNQNWISSFPHFEEYGNYIEAWQEEIPTLGTEIGEAEDWCLTPNRFYIKNNINVDSPDNIGLLTQETADEYSPSIVADASIFKDTENHDYTIVDESVLAQMKGEFEQIPMEKIGLIREGTRWENWEMPEFRTPVYPKPGYENRVLPMNIEFDWWKVQGSSYYRLEIAEDESFENIVYDEELMYSKATVNLEPDKHYYYRITANSFAKSLNNASVQSDVYDFYTYSLEEANEVMQADKRAAQEAIREAKLFAEKIVEGENPGEYKQGTKAELLRHIADSEAYIEANNIQNLIDEKQKDVYRKIFEAQQNVNPSLTTLDVSADNWEQLWDPNKAGGDISKMSIEQLEDGSTRTICSASTYFQNKTVIPYGSFASIKVKTDTLESWQVYGLAFGGGNAEGLSKNNLYSLVMSTNSENRKYSLEMQIYSERLRRLETVNNENNIVPDEWVELTLGTIPTENGTRFIMIIGDDVIYDYEDSYEDGCFYEDSNFLALRTTAGNTNYFAQSERTLEEVMEIVNSQDK